MLSPLDRPTLQMRSPPLWQLWSPASARASSLRSSTHARVDLLEAVFKSHITGKCVCTAERQVAERQAAERQAAARQVAKRHAAERQVRTCACHPRVQHRREELGQRVHELVALRSLFGLHKHTTSKHSVSQSYLENSRGCAGHCFSIQIYNHNAMLWSTHLHEHRPQR